MEKLKVLEFTNNWNNKLNCDHFTSLRMTDRFGLNEKIKITFKKKLKGKNIIEEIGTGKIIGKIPFLISKINNFVGYLDTGYSGIETQEMIKKMYSSYKINWNTRPIIFYLIKVIDRDLSLFGFKEK